MRLAPLLFALAVAIAWCALLWCSSAARFGRAGTQAWIDRLKGRPRLQAFFNRWHSEIRASVHYFEFGGLFFILYLLAASASAAHGDGRPWRWRPLVGLGCLGVTCVAAYLDEYRQGKTPGRQFRRVDLMASCLGAGLAFVATFLVCAIVGGF